MPRMPWNRHLHHELDPEAHALYSEDFSTLFAQTFQHPLPKGSMYLYSRYLSLKGVPR